MVTAFRGGTPLDFGTGRRSENNASECSEQTVFEDGLARLGDRRRDDDGGVHDGGSCRRWWTRVRTRLAR